MAAYPKEFATQRPLYVQICLGLSEHNEKGDALPYGIWELTTIAFTVQD